MIVIKIFQGHKSSYRQYGIFEAQNCQNYDKSSNLAVMLVDP